MVDAGKDGQKNSELTSVASDGDVTDHAEIVGFHVPVDEPKGSATIPDSPGELSYRHPVFEFFPDTIGDRSEGLRIIDQLRQKLLVSVQMLDLIRDARNERIVFRVHYADWSFDQYPLDPKDQELAIVDIGRNPRSAQSLSAHVVDANKNVCR